MNYSVTGRVENERGPLLSVGIPTWNRARYLAEGVDSLVAQVERYGLRDEVEVLVSDNASEDETPALMLERAGRFPYVRYSRNDRNRGVMYNLLHLMRSARGRYVIIVGDDDRFTEGSLAAILEVLRENPDLPAVFLRNESPDAAFKGIEDDPVRSLDDLYRRYFYDIGNTGIFVANVARCREVIEEYGIAFFNESWGQTQVICLSLAGAARAPLVTNIAAVNNDLHASVTIYSAYYLWHVSFADLLLAARALRPILGEQFWRSASSNLYPRLEKLVEGIVFYGSLVDTKEQRARAARSIRRLIPVLPWGRRLTALYLWLHVGLPRPLSAALCKARVGLQYGFRHLRVTRGEVERELGKRRLSVKERSVREMSHLEKS